jgi:hypothetical protein
MKYEINEDVKNLITQMCDLALKQGGLSNKQGVDIVLNMLSTPIPDLREVKKEE